MPKRYLGFLSSVGSEGNAVLEDFRGFDAMRPDVTHTSADDADDDGSLDAADRDQLEDDIAEIERASAALCKAEPALESWTSPPANTMQKPRPIWLLIGVLWLSTALVTLGAVVAIAALVG
ncbi:MAG TPA: hypothetical protein VJX48_01700 [Xanthobacteraceae bacterium]|nr:hypothetical protein [Xanthobacteraceae bacterium]